MPGPSRPKKLPIERTSLRIIFFFSFSPLFPSLSRQGEKRGYSQSPPENENENQKPVKKIVKPTTTIDSIPGIPFPPLSPE